MAAWRWSPAAWPTWNSAGWLEGGRVSAQRPHKALSAWPMAATVLLPSFYLLPVVALVYAHARWRGVRVTLWKWIGSACFLICAGAISGVILDREGDGAPPTLSSGFQGLLFMVGAVLTFLADRMRRCSGCRRGSNTPEDEVWLRKTLADPSFYVVEFGVLTLGALTGLLGANAPWFVLMLIPAYGFLQQSVLHRPLQERATRDPKTGLLHFNAWQRLATDEIRRLNSAGRSWAVLFADIDHFRFYNERHGHLGGDHALKLVAQILTANVRPKDIIARFGGEEFCVLLPDTVADDRRADRRAGAGRDRQRDLGAARGGDGQRRRRRGGGQQHPDGAGRRAGARRPGALPRPSWRAGTPCGCASRWHRDSIVIDPVAADRPGRGTGSAPAGSAAGRSTPSGRSACGDRALPDAHPVGRVQPQPVAGLDAEGRVELVEVAHHLVAAELGRRVRVDRQQPQLLGVADLRLPDRRPGQEEPLLAGQPVDDLGLAGRPARSARPGRRCARPPRSPMFSPTVSAPLT